MVLKLIPCCLLAALALVGCSKKQTIDATRSAPPAKLIQGPFFHGPIRYQFAIYYLPTPSKPPEPVLKSLVAEEFKQWKLSAKAGGEDEMTISPHFLEHIGDSYRPPSLESLRYSGRGITQEQAAALQESQSAFILDFQCSQGHVWDGMLSACRLQERLARETGGLLWDEETREVFSPAKWNEQRITTWKADVPEIAKHTVIHAYKKETFVRGITLGMAKFGLPDIVVDDFSWELNRNVGHLINLFGQAMAEGGVVSAPGEFQLDLQAIRCAEAREPQRQSLKPHATGVARLNLREGVWEEGDPKNRLVKIGFDHYEGPDRHARQEKLIGEFFGWTDKISHVKSNELLLEASRRARARLPQLASDFANGLAPGETILVKAPFVSNDGAKEYMWIEVTEWNATEITGLLRSEPYYVTTLQAGQVMHVHLQDVYDYIRKFPDGTREGNETGKLIEAQRAETKSQ